MNLQPLNDRALLRPLPPKEGKIIIPERLKDEPEQIHARVVALGDRSDKRDWSFKVGQTVLTTDYMGAEVMMGKTRHLIMREKDILAIVGEIHSPTTRDETKAAEHGLKVPIDPYAA